MSNIVPDFTWSLKGSFKCTFVPIPKPMTQEPYLH